MNGGHDRSDNKIFGRVDVLDAGEETQLNDELQSLLRQLRFQPVSEERKAEITMCLHSRKSIRDLNRDEHVAIALAIGPLLPFVRW